MSSVRTTAGPVAARPAALWWLWALCAAVAVVCEIGWSPALSDMDLFSGYGQHLLDGQLGQVYASDWVQAGPLQLLGSHLLMLGGAFVGVPVPVRVAVDLGVLAAVRGCSRRLGAGPLATTAAACVTTLWLGPLVFWVGHPIEGFIPLLWLAAGADARHGRWLRSGLALAGATAIAPWALLGAPVLLGARSVDWLRAGLVGAVAAVAAYLPFVASGHFEMFHRVWLVSPHTLVHLVAPHAVTFEWAGRLVEAVLVVGGAALTAVRLRHRPDGILFAVLVCLTARILIDPKSFGYYWVPVGAVTVAALLRASARKQVIARAVLALAGWCAMAFTVLVPVTSPFVALAFGALVVRRTRDDRTHLAAPDDARPSDTMSETDELARFHAFLQASHEDEATTELVDTYRAGPERR